TTRERWPGRARSALGGVGEPGSTANAVANIRRTQGIGERRGVSSVVGRVRHRGRRWHGTDLGRGLWATASDAEEPQLQGVGPYLQPNWHPPGVRRRRWSDRPLGSTPRLRSADAPPTTQFYHRVGVLTQRCQFDRYRI